MPEVIHFRDSDKIIKEKGLSRMSTSPLDMWKLCSTAPCTNGS